SYVLHKVKQTTTNGIGTAPIITGQTINRTKSFFNMLYRIQKFILLLPIMIKFFAINPEFQNGYRRTFKN
ncbi:MAG: hypothetical protein MZV70_11140, partial [Desulfobacterales bacterium]|nr:hypothetical protein [Desulfobacterales bacterium]